MKTRSLALGLAFLAAGCGGGGGSSPPPPPPPAPPTITVQPQNLAVNAGQSATLSVTASGVGPLSYQWNRSAAPISGATSASYTLSSAQVSDDGAVFTVAVSNAGGTTTSAQATLSINKPPTITAQPSPLAVSIGDTPTFSVTVSGTAPFGYQWSLNGNPIAGATSESYTAPAAGPNDNGDQFTVVVTNVAGNITSAAAGLKVTGLYVLAGHTGGAGYVDGSLAQARFEYPQGIAVDVHGNIFVSDLDMVREITTAGTVLTLAGSALRGAADGPGGAARFSGPIGVAVDPNDNVSVADYNNSTIRMITPQGLVTTIAGRAGITGSTDGAPTTQALFDHPFGLAADGTGNVYVADSFNFSIRLLGQGSVSTIAGPGPTRGTPVDGTGSAAGFRLPTAVAWATPGGAVPSPGYLAVADWDAIRIVTPRVGGDPVTTAAGNNAFVLGSADGPALSATFGDANGVAVDSANNVYVADTGNNTIRVLKTIGGVPTVSTLAGTSGTFGSANGTGAAASFFSPAGLAVDATGNVYVADTGNCQVRKVTPAGVTTTVAGVSPNYGHADGAGTAATFTAPRAMVRDATGNLYVVDPYDMTVRKITPTGVVSTLAGAHGQTGEVDGTGAEARFNSPAGIAIDAAGNLYVTDWYGDTIRMVTPAGVVTTIAGTANTPGELDGAGTAARFKSPARIAIDESGNLYVTDNGGQTVRKITPPPAAEVTTIAGLARTAGSADGVGSAARFNGPFGIAVDANGNVFVGDNGNGTLRVISPVQVVTTIAGTPGTFGFNDGTGASVQFAGPYGLVLDPSGALYIADGENGLIRKAVPNTALTSATVSTVVGTPNSPTLGVTTGALPGKLNWPRDILILSSSPTTLVIGDSSDAAIIGVLLP